MTKHNSPALARENPLVPYHGVSFSYVGGVMADRGMTLRDLGGLIKLPHTTLRTWLQGGITKPGRGLTIQNKVGWKLGIIITESPYEI